MSKLDHPPVLAQGGASQVVYESPAAEKQENSEEENEVHITSPIVGNLLFRIGTGYSCLRYGGR